MPRTNKDRTFGREDIVAERIERIRLDKGWTYESFAKRITNRGCDIHPSALYKIEKGNPRRRITVDELIAISEVFDIGLADLAAPIHADADIAALAQDVDDRYQGWTSAAQIAAQAQSEFLNTEKGYYRALDRLDRALAHMGIDERLRVLSSFDPGWVTAEVLTNWRLAKDKLQTARKEAQK